MKEQLMAAIAHWFESVSPARKAADIFVAFIIAILAGGLYSAYNAESDIRRIALKALNKTPELNQGEAQKLSVALLADIQKAGGLAAACFKVDLAGNTTQLVFYVGPDSMRDKFPRLKLGFDKVPFIAPNMPPEQVEIAGSMMTGTYDVVYIEKADVTLVCVPVPDRSGAYLAAFTTVAIQGKHDDASPTVANLRLILSDFSNNVL